MARGFKEKRKLQSDTKGRPQTKIKRKKTFITTHEQSHKRHKKEKKQIREGERSLAGEEAFADRGGEGNVPKLEKGEGDWCIGFHH